MKYSFSIKNNISFMNIAKKKKSKKEFQTISLGQKGLYFFLTLLILVLLVSQFHRNSINYERLLVSGGAVLGVFGSDRAECC